MARITKFELEQLLAAAQSEVLALRTRVSQLTADVALRDARIERGHALVCEMQARSSVAPSIVKPIITRFTRGGQVWEKTRVGNRSTERVVDELADDKLAQAREVFDRDLAHEADMRELAREQLRGEDLDDEDFNDDFDDDDDDDGEVARDYYPDDDARDYCFDGEPEDARDYLND